MTEQDFQKTLEERIAKIEAGIPEVRPMRRRDYIEVGIIVFICLAGIVAGTFL